MVIIIIIIALFFFADIYLHCAMNVFKPITCIIQFNLDKNLPMSFQF